MIEKLVVGISGASGAIYGAALIGELLRQPLEVHVVVTPDGRQVMAHELGSGGRLDAILDQRWGGRRHSQARMIEHAADNFFAPPASGSFRHQGMVVAPCSVKTLGAIAGGLADNLMVRAADICLKERRPLILVPRETPLSRIHLHNMLRVTDAGATVLPPAPAFYFQPESIQDMVDFVVGRILDQLGVAHNLLAQWGDDDKA